MAAPPEAAPPEAVPITADELPRTIGELIRRSAERYPDRAAIVTLDQRITYRELVELSDRYARALVALGVGKGTHVGLLMENRPEWLAIAFAATGIGAVLVPISTFSKAGDLEYQLRHADVSHLLMSDRFLGNEYLQDLISIAPELKGAEPGRLFTAALPALRHVVMTGAVAGDDGDLPQAARSWASFESGADAIPEAVVAALQAEVVPQDECYLLYTSGTTARPKGALHIHEAVATNGYRIGEHQGITPDDVSWFYFPFFFSAGCCNVSLGSLSHGATLLVQDTFDPGVAIELIDREGATAWHLWPHTLKALMEHPDWQTKDHSKLHKGTGPFELMLGITHEDGMGGVNMYGMTETCTAFSCTRADDPGDVRVMTQGYPFEGCTVKIVDPATGAPVGPDEEGEICVKGINVMVRYYKVDPAETFDEDGFFHTGDLGMVRADGRLCYKQRLKDTIKTGGINVSPGEVEWALRAIEGVGEAYVFAIPSPDRGEEVAAAIVPVEGSGLDEKQIYERTKDTLSGYKRPKALLFLKADEVPMTGSGKVQTFVLRQRLLEQLRSTEGPSSSS